MDYNTDEIIDAYFKGKNTLVKHQLESFNNLIDNIIPNIFSQYFPITLDYNDNIIKKIILKRVNETIFIPLGSIHRVENKYKTPLKIIEAQVGSILKETDIVRYHDIYGRAK